MGLLAVGGAWQQEGEVARFQDLSGLLALAGELQVDAFQTVMAGNVPNPEFLAKMFLFFLKLFNQLQIDIRG